MLPVSPAGRRYGYLKDTPDYRDFGVARSLVARPRSTQPVTLPSSYSLRRWEGPIKDQDDLGACTAFSGASMFEMLCRSQLNTQPVFSPLFMYYKEREHDGVLGQGDTGSYGRSACWVMNHVGLCLEQDDAYDPAQFDAPPTDAQIAEAARFKSGAYHRLFSVDDMKSCLFSGYSFVMGFTVYQSFEGDQIEKDGLMPVPRWGFEKIEGGHEVHVVGYDDSILCPNAQTPGAFDIQNSWGPGWGDSGHFKMPYECAADPRVMMDAWMQHLGPAWR